MKKYNAVNSKWLLFGLVIPILLFFLSFNAVYAYFTATAAGKQVSTQTAIVKIGFKPDDNDSYTNHEIIRSATTNSAENLIPGDILKANATVINNGNVSVYCIINFKLGVTKQSSTKEEVIVNDFYTFTSAGGQLTNPLELKSTYAESACLINSNGEVSLNVQTEFDGAIYGNEYINADVKYTFTAYAIQTTGLTASSAIEEIVTDLLQGGNRIITISGNSVQNGTPTPDAPVEIESVGEKTKNLFNKATVEVGKNLDANTGTLYNSATRGVSDYIEVDSSKTYTVYRPYQGSATRYINCYDSNKGYLGQDAVTLVSGNGFGGYCVYQFTSDVAYIRANFWYTEDNSINEKDGLIIYEGSEELSYEPYGYKVPVKTTGKNLVDVSSDKNTYGYLNVDGSVISHSSIKYTDYIAIPDNTTNIVFSNMGSNGMSAPATCFYDKDKIFISGEAFGGLDTKTFKIPNNARYFRTCFRTSYTEYMAEFGIDATDYEIYQETITNIYLDEPLRKVGDYADYIDLQTGKVVRNVGKLTNIANLNWMAISNYYQAMLNFTLNAENRTSSLCNYLIYGNANIANSFWFDGSGTGMRVAGSGFSDVDTLKQWLSSVEIYVLYPLETPTEETISIPSTLQNPRYSVEFLTEVQPEANIKFTIIQN